MNSAKEMTIILERNFSVLNKEEKDKITKIIKSINMPMPVPNNFPQIMRKAIKETAKVRKIKLSQERYYDEFLSHLDTSMEFMSSNDYKPSSPSWIKYAQKMFPNDQIDNKDETIENYYYPNFDANKDNDYITLNSYKKYLSGEKRPSIIRMRNLLKYFEETANVPDTRKYGDEPYNINYLQKYIHFSYHQTLFTDMNQEINYIFGLIIDSLNCLVKMNQVISQLLPSSYNTFNENITWINHFSKFNAISFDKLNLAKKILHLEEIKLTDISKITQENRNIFFKQINYYMEEAQSSLYDNLLTGKTTNTIIGHYIDNYFSHKYYEITSPSWIPVQINEAKFIYTISMKSILDFLRDMPCKIKTTNDLLNTPGVDSKK